MNPTRHPTGSRRGLLVSTLLLGIPALAAAGEPTNIAPLAAARARSEYLAPLNLGNEEHRAVRPAHGTGDWASAGPNANGIIQAPPVSDVHPQWYVLGWTEPHAITAVQIKGNLAEFRVETFTGPDTITPLAGVDSEWRRVKQAEHRIERRDGIQIIFTKPLTTRGLRLWITKVAGDPRNIGHTQVALIQSVKVLADMGTAEQKVTTPTAAPPPYEIAYDPPQEGIATLVVDDAKGRRVRNLFAREERAAGPTRLAWDLTDESGRTVAPGTYRVKGITGPPLELRYQTTTYPNVALHHPENSPWLNGNSGPGGWLADHTPPISACTAGEHLFFGSPVPESGVGFAACDLSGRKRWGIHSFSAWSGGNRLATDGTTVFVEQEDWQAGPGVADRVWAVDIASQKSRPLYQAKATPDRLRGARGIAARDGRVVLAITGRENRLGNACDAAAVDIANCLPAYKPARKPRVAYEIVPDERSDFLRLCRLAGNPPGYGHPHGQGLIDLESTRGPGARQHVMLAFTRPVPIGSCVFPVPTPSKDEKPYRVKLSVLKPDAAYPPDPGRRDQWIDFERQATAGWDVAIAPAATATRALLVTFYTDDDDELSDALAADQDARPATPSLDLDADSDPGLDPGAGAGDAWLGKIEGLRILRRRFANVAAAAKVAVNSGAVRSDGVWIAKPVEPLSQAAPAIYMLQWPKPQKVSGLAIKEVDGEKTEIDVWTGPEGAPIDIEGGEHWEQVADFTSQRRMNHPNFEGHNALARYLDETVDFGRDIETRAVRLRVVSQFATATREGSCAKDGLGLDLSRCRIFGVAALTPAGGDAPADPLLAERLEVIDGTSGKVEKEIAIAKPEGLAFAPSGLLHAVSAGRVVTVDLAATAGADHPPFPLPAGAVKEPGPIACDTVGNLYVFDRADDRRVVSVFDPAGKLLRTVGEPGGHEVGPWNPRRFNEVTALAVDREGKLWVVEHTTWPKRISCWSPAGEFLREYLGPTEYGGGGVIDPADVSRMFYGPLEFAIDWKTAASRLVRITARGTLKPGEQPIHVEGRTYLVTRPTFTKQPCGVVHLVEADRVRPVAAIGRGDALAPLSGREFNKLLGGKPPGSFEVIWTDSSGDGAMQPEECRVEPLSIGSLSAFDSALAINAGPAAFEVKRFLPDGTPEYVKKVYDLPVPKDAAIFRLDGGRFYRLGDGPNAPDAVFAADGTTLWTYPNEGAGVGPDRSCGPFTPGQVVCQFGVAGHTTAPSGDLGEFFVVHTNFGGWNLWTADGLLAARIFRDYRQPKTLTWSMPEHERGLRLDDVTTGQEHFQASFCRVEADGRMLAVAGHNHASVVEVAGLDRFRRFGGEITVSPEQVKQAEAWRREVAIFKAGREPRVLEIPAVEGAASSRPWDRLPTASLPADENDPGRQISFQVCRDKHNLYLRYDIRGAGPFANTGNQWDRLFKTGACVDLMLGLDPAADPARRAPVAGDKRILVGATKGKPTVVLYDAVVPNAKPDEKLEVTSPTGRTEFDVARVLDAATARVDGSVVEVTLPLAAIGLDAKPGTRIKLDWGVLETDKAAASVLRRSYWSNTTTTTLADAPTEARLEPDLWGYAIFTAADASGPRLPDATNLLDPDADAAADFELEEP